MSPFSPPREWRTLCHHEDISVRYPGPAQLRISSTDRDRTEDRMVERGMAVAEANRSDSSADRLTRIQRVLDEVLMRRAAGETLPDDVVVSQHSDLMPELGERLQALKSAQEAGRPAVPPRPAAAGASNPLEGRCPFCQSRVRVKAEHAGRRVRCKCGRVFVADLPSGGDGAFAIPPPPPELAAPIAGYEIERELGLGGMGRVYLAREVATKRQVALKVMLAGRSANERDRRRFEREVEIAASLEHPNIARLYATGIHEGHYWFAMEYVEGERLDQFAARRNLGVRDILVLFGRVCEAVNYAHQRGIMHRDLKPGNILVDRAGQPRVLDLGLAKVADPTADIEQTISMGGELAGTPAYMSPEQIQGGPTGLDVRSDVYSLGVVLYQLLTGQSPYGPTTGLPDLLRAVVEREPQPPRQVRPDIPDEVAAIILKAIEKHRAQRYQTAGDLGRDIAAHLAGKPVSAKGQGGWYRLRKMLVRRKRAAITVAAVVGLSLGLGLLFASLYSKTRVELQEVIREKEVWRDRTPAPEAPVSTPGPPEAPVSTPVPSPAAPAPAPKAASPWVRIFDGETLSGWSEPRGGSGSARVNNGAIEVTGYELTNTAIYHQMEASDMAISAQVKKVAGDHGSLYLRHGPQGVYLATFKGGGKPGDFPICKYHSGSWTELAVNKTPITLIDSKGRPGNEGFFEMTFRAVGTLLTVEVQGREILRVEDADLDYGSPGIGGTALFRDIYVWVPDKQGAAGGGQPGAGAPASSTGADAAGTSQALPAPNTLTPEEQALGWRLLFDGKTTAGWRGYRAADLPEGWRVKDSALVGAGNRSHIVTTAQYDDFDLTLECMIEERGNSGIMYRVTEDADEPYQAGPEFEVQEDRAYGNQNSNRNAGACYRLYAPRQQVTMPPDTWIKIRLLAAGSFIQHWVNGEKVVEYRIGSDDWNQRLAASQYREKPKFGRNSTGYICLQAYTGTVRFRNIKIRPLADGAQAPPLPPGSAADMKNALWWLDQACDDADRISTDLGRAEAHFWIARTYARAGDVARARLALHACGGFLAKSAAGYGAYAHIAAAQAKAGDATGAQRTLDEVKAAISALPDQKAKDEAFVKFSEELTWAEFLPGAKTVASEIASDAWQRHWQYWEIAMYEAKAGDVAGAGQTVQTLVAMAAGIGKLDTRANLYRSIAHVRLQIGDVNGARQSLDAAKTANLADGNSWTRGDIARLYAKIGELGHAKAIAATIDRAGRMARAYTLIAEVQRKAGDVAGATQTLGLAKALAAATADAREKTWMYADIARWQALCGNAPGALETIQTALIAAPAITDAKQRGEAYGGIALAQADAGDLDGVRATMRLIRPIVASVGYNEKLVSAYVVCRQAEKGDVVGAKETTSLIPREAKSADVAAWYVAAAQAKAGDYNGARATAEAIATVEWRDRAYQAVAEGQARRGDLATLRAWVDSLTDPAVRAYACVGAAEGLLPPPKIVGLGMWD